VSHFTDFTRRVTGWRETPILVGDTLRSIALRELGDASRWVDLVHLNELRSPYIVATPAERSAQPHTRAYGEVLRIPSAARLRVAVSDRGAVYGRDLGLWRGRARVDRGDFVTRTGTDNLRQAVVHRIATDPGEIPHHPYYGCHVRLVLGEKYTDVVRLLAQAFVVEALEAEPRVARIARADFERGGDTVGLALEVNPITGEFPVEANLVFPVS